MAKTKRAPKKANKKTGKELHTIRSIRNSADKWSQTLKESRERYVTKPFETGKSLISDLRDDPIRMAEGWYEDGKEFMGDLAKDPNGVFKEFADKGRESLDALKKGLMATRDDVVDSGNDLYNGMKKDSMKFFDDLVAGGRKFADKIPMVKRIGKGVENTLQSVPSKLNLPNKKEMDDLAKAIKALNRRMNALSKEVAA